MKCYLCHKEGHFGGHCLEPTKVQSFRARLEDCGVFVDSESVEGLLEESVVFIERLSDLIDERG